MSNIYVVKDILFSSFSFLLCNHLTYLTIIILAGWIVDHGKHYLVCAIDPFCWRCQCWVNFTCCPVYCDSSKVVTQPWASYWLSLSANVFCGICWKTSFTNNQLIILSFMVKDSDTSNFRDRFVYGMTYFIWQVVFFFHIQQSLLLIIFKGLPHISIKLQRVLWSRKENQQRFSSFSLKLSELTWSYNFDMLEVQEHQAEKVNTFSCLSGRDFSTTRVKVLRVKDREALLHLIVLIGISAVVGVWKTSPKVSRVKQHDRKSSDHQGTLKTDLINFYWHNKKCLHTSAQNQV